MRLVISVPEQPLLLGLRQFVQTADCDIVFFPKKGKPDRGINSPSQSNRYMYSAGLKKRCTFGRGAGYAHDISARRDTGVCLLQHKIPDYPVQCVCKKQATSWLSSQKQQTVDFPSRSPAVRVAARPDVQPVFLCRQPIPIRIRKRPRGMMTSISYYWVRVAAPPLTITGHVSMRPVMMMSHTRRPFYSCEKPAARNPNPMGC